MKSETLKRKMAQIKAARKREPREVLLSIIRGAHAEIEALTEQRDRYRAALVVIAGSSDKLQALQAACALDNIGPEVT